MKYVLNEKDVIIGISYEYDIDIVLDANLNFGVDRIVDGKLVKTPIVRPERGKPSYESLVERHIRERYSVSQELAIHRQSDSKPDEWAEYNAYCEECKVKAKSEVVV